MMYLKRKADAFLDVWKKEPGHTPLIVKGARQVGKTETIRRFANKKENSTLEEDFFIRTADSLVPVEVKAVGGRAKSLRTLIASERYEEIKFGIKLGRYNIGFENAVYTFPHFCAFLLKRWLKERTALAVDG